MTTEYLDGLERLAGLLREVGDPKEYADETIWAIENAALLVALVNAAPAMLAELRAGRACRDALYSGPNWRVYDKARAALDAALKGDDDAV